MKFLVVALFFVTSSALADPWTTGDTWREASYAGLLLLDCGQTRNIAQDPNQYAEGNPIVRTFTGAHPSTGQVDNVCAGTLLLHVAVAALLPAEWRANFQYVTIGGELYAVGHNFSIGLRVRF